MKFSSLILGSLFTAQLFAAPIACNGGEYSLVTDAEHKTATVTQNGQEVQFGNLTCNTEGTGDKTYVSCLSQGVADAGYYASFELTTPGVDATGTLNEQSFAGSRKIADLTCVHAAN